MKQQFLTAIYGFATLTAVLAAPAASAQIAQIKVMTPNLGGTLITYEADLYDSLFVGTSSGFAVGSTSPNFGGSAMATASSTNALHSADVELFQTFTLPSFITSALITIDFKGYAYATGNAVGYVHYIIDKQTASGSTFLGSRAVSTEVPEIFGGIAGPVNLSARETFTLFGGESMVVTTRAIADAGGTDGYGIFTYYAGPGYATAFMDPIVTISAAVPEPTTWAMLIAGFGLVGAASRHRRTRATAA